MSEVLHGVILWIVFSMMFTAGWVVGAAVTTRKIDETLWGVMWVEDAAIEEAAIEEVLDFYDWLQEEQRA